VDEEKSFLLLCMQMTKSIGTIAVLACFAAFSMGSRAMAIEEAPFTLSTKSGKFELRHYQPYIVAATVVEGDFERVGNEGFRRLVDYINGHNRRRQSIAMTAPVGQQSESQKIAMTAPVGQQRSSDQWRITFMMPAGYSLETLPEPLDERILLQQVPARQMAAVRYSGTWSRTGYEKNLARLLAWLQEQGLKPIGEPVWARYNPPFMPWFLRRNEVLIAVQKNR
jgi:effector-binding domain-containing protein